MKKQLLVLLMLGAFIGQAWGAQSDIDPNDADSNGEYGSFLKIINDKRLKKGGEFQLPPAQEKIRMRINKDIKAIDSLEDTELEWLMFRLPDFQGVVEQLLKGKSGFDPGKLATATAETVKQLELMKKARAGGEEEVKKLAAERKKAEEARKVRERELAEEAARLAEKTRKAQEQLETAKKAKAERLRLKQERLEQERIAEEQEASRKREREDAERIELEKKRVAELARVEELEKARIAELEEAAAKEKEKLAEIERLRIQEEMRLFEAEKQRKKTAQEEQEANLRMIAVAETWFKEFDLTCANCPNKTCSGCTIDKGKECDAFNLDRFCRAALRTKGKISEYPLDNLFPIYFDDTYGLWSAQTALEAADAKSKTKSLRQATNEEYSPLFRLLYDCARGFYEDPDLRQWALVKRKKLENYGKAGIEAPELKSWAEKLPLLISALKEHGFNLKSFDVIASSGYYNSFLYRSDYRYKLGIDYDSSASQFSPIAEYFKKSKSVYEKDIFANTDSKIYSYMGTLTEANLNCTQAGRDALALVAAQEQQEQAQKDLAQFQATVAAAMPPATSDDEQASERGVSANEAADVGAMDLDFDLGLDVGAMDLDFGANDEADEQEALNLAPETAAAPEMQMDEAAGNAKDLPGLVRGIYLYMLAKNLGVEGRLKLAAMKDSLIGYVQDLSQISNLKIPEIKQILIDEHIDNITDQVAGEVHYEIITLWSEGISRGFTKAPAFSLEEGPNGVQIQGMPALTEFILDLGRNFNDKSVIVTTGMLAAGRTFQEFAPSKNVIDEVLSMKTNATEEDVKNMIKVLWEKNNVHVQPVMLTAVADLIFRLHQDPAATIEVLSPSVSVSSESTIARVIKEHKEQLLRNVSGLTGLIDENQNSMREELANIAPTERRAYIIEIAKQLELPTYDLGYFIKRLLHP